MIINIVSARLELNDNYGPFVVFSVAGAVLFFCAFFQLLNGD